MAASAADSIQPLAVEHRVMTPASYAFVFWSSGIIVQIMVIGLYLLHPVGPLNFVQVLAVGVVASVLVASFMTLQGHAGAKYGIPFVIQGRTAFGVQGARIVAVIRCIPAVAWNGIGSWIGALALDQVTSTIFGWGSVWLYFIILLVAQSVLAYTGIAGIAWFNAVMSFVIFAMLLYFFYVVFREGNIDFQAASSVPGSWGLAWIAGMMAAFANWTTVVLNASDITRQIKPGRRSPMTASAIGNFAGVIPPWLFMVVSGMLIGLATGKNDPIAGLVELSPNPGFGILLLLFIILAQITSNLTLNILPPALALQDLLGISWRKGVVVVAILSVVTAPWLLFTSDYFFKFQNVYASFLGPATAVMLADYFVLRRTRLDVPLLYTQGSPYRYLGGFSVVGLTATLAGAVAAFLFLDYSWLVGFPVSFLLYLALKRWTRLEPPVTTETTGQVVPA
jgi:NCS1 family nucleobase:cation symporter-1